LEPQAQTRIVHLLRRLQAHPVVDAPAGREREPHAGLGRVEGGQSYDDHGRGEENDWQCDDREWQHPPRGAEPALPSVSVGERTEPDGRPHDPPADEGRIQRPHGLPEDAVRVGAAEQTGRRRWRPSAGG